MLNLDIEQRDTKTKLEAVRKGGKLPAVFYGRKEKSTPIAITLSDFEKVWREAGESSIISLNGVGDNKEALIQDVSVHAVTGKPIHADFYVVEKDKKLTVSVPLEFVGESPAVEELGGTLVKVLHELEVEVLPKDLPHEITVDISGLTEFGNNILVKDLALPEGVEAVDEPDETVALVSEPKEEEEEEEEEVGEIDMDAIEVEEKGKKEEEGEEGDDGEAPAPEGEEAA